MSDATIADLAAKFFPHLLPQYGRLRVREIIRAHNRRTNWMELVCHQPSA